MRILKDLPLNHIEDRFYDKNTPIGAFLDRIKSTIGNEKEFLSAIASRQYWDSPKISLWALEEIINYLDDLLAVYKSDVLENQNKIELALNFIKLILTNTTNKDIFTSFDHIQDIYLNTNCLSLKTLALDVYLCFSEIKNTLLDNYVDMIDYSSFLIPFRPVFVDFLLNIKSDTIKSEDEIKENFCGEIEKILFQIIKDWRKAIMRKEHCHVPGHLKSKAFEQEMKSILKKILTTSDTIFTEIYTNLNASFTSKEKIKEETLLYQTLINFFILCSQFNLSKITYDTINNEYKIISKFTLNMINLIITGSQKKSKTPLISEYYIERYLKDVLSILTSRYDLEMKSTFLMATISFVTYFDGYENILFQNGLFHSILSDMTSSKFSSSSHLEIMTYEESINQDFFHTVLFFLYKTSSFKEIPVHFLNKVLELPKDNVYPFRIDNVIFSLKKKRTLDESTLNELIVPRLIYELKSIWVEEDKLRYLFSGSSDVSPLPSIFERTNLIHKLFKILYSIFEHNTNTSSLRYYETVMIESVQDFIKKVYDKFIQKTDTYFDICPFEPLLVHCVDFIAKICIFLPTKISSLIENSCLKTIFDFFSIRTPPQPSIMNLIFHLLYSVSLQEEGKKFILENDTGKKFLTNLFNSMYDQDYLFSNLFSHNNFVSDEFYTPYTSFLQIENMNSLIVFFFDKIAESLIKLKDIANKIFMNKDESSPLSEVLDPTKNWCNVHLYRIWHGVYLTSQFFMNISKDERDYLIEEQKINMEDLILSLFELIFHPLSLLSMNSTVLSNIVIKTFEKNPEKLINRTVEMFNYNCDLLFGDSCVFNERQKDKIITKMTNLIEFTVKKLFSSLLNKEILYHLTVKVTMMMVRLIKKQSNINLYMSPVNDCILIINQKSYYKFLSSKLKPVLRELLLKRTKESIAVTLNTVANPKVTIFDEYSSLDLKYRMDLGSNMRVEIIEASNPFVSELIDSDTKMLINSHMPTLDYFIMMGKNLKSRSVKSFTAVDVSTVKLWYHEAYALVEVLRALDPKIKIIDVKGNDEALVEILINYINIMNNINIVISDKNFSGFVIFQFLKMGGVEKIIDICVFLLKVTDILSNSPENPLIVLLLIKNLWNIISSLLMRLLKYNFESQSSFPILLLKEDFNSISEIANYSKLIMLSTIYHFFLSSQCDSNCSINNISASISTSKGYSSFTLADIERLSYSFYSLILAIFDTCLSQFKTFLESDKKESEGLIKTIENMGFKKIDIILAMQEGNKTSNEIVNYLLRKSPQPENAEQQDNKIQAEEGTNPMEDIIDKDKIIDTENKNKNENEKDTPLNMLIKLKPEVDPSFVIQLKQELSQFYQSTNTADNTLQENFYQPGECNLKEAFIEMFSNIYKILIDSNLSQIKISQIRKMNIMFRIKEIVYSASNLGETLLIPFLKEIFILERENFIDVQGGDDIMQISSTENPQSQSQSLKRLLQNKMLINYIIFKDRSKMNNIFEKLDIDAIANFFDEFKVIENNIMTIHSLLNRIEFELKHSTTLTTSFAGTMRSLIYESHLIIFLSFNFIAYYTRTKGDSCEIKFNIDKCKKHYYDTFLKLMELDALATGRSSVGVIDEGNLIIIFATIVESFENDEAMQEFLEKGGLRSILKLKVPSQDNTQGSSYNFNENKFKYKVTLDEAFRLFLFKIFEDQKSQELMIESIIKYVFANYYNFKSEMGYASEFKKKNQQDKDTEMKAENENPNEANNSNNFTSNNCKSLIDTTANDTNIQIEMNFEDFINIIYPLVPQNREIFLNTLKRICVVDKKMEKLIKRKKGKSSNNNPEIPTLVIRLQSEYNSSVISIASEMKDSKEDVISQPAENEIKKECCVTLGPGVSQVQSKGYMQASGNVSVSKQRVNTNIVSSSIKPSSKKKIEDEIMKISKQFSATTGKIINRLIKHVWELTLDMEKEIEKSLHNSEFIIAQRYLIDLDSALIALGNLLNAYPSVISLILKYHKQMKNKDKDKDKISFISFMIRKIFYVLSFYKNCMLLPSGSNMSNTDMLESLTKDKEDITRKLGYEVNTHQAAMEAYRNHNIISFLIQALCFRKRTYTCGDIVLIQKARKRVLNELNAIITEIASKHKDDFNTNQNINYKNILLYKVSVFSLYAMTEFHDSSHAFSQLNPFEMSKLIFSKDYEIIKSIVDIMKSLFLANPTAISAHKYTTLFLSEIFRFIRINSKMIKGTVLSKNDYSSNGKKYFKDIIIEANVLPDDQNLGNDTDILMREIEDRIGGEDEDEESEERENDNINYENEEDNNPNDGSPEDSEEESEEEGESDEMFYTISSSESEEEEEEDNSENEESDEFEGSEGEGSNNSNPNDNEGINININITDDQPNPNANLLNFIENDNDENEEEEYEEDEMSEEDYAINDMHNNEVSVQFNEDGNEYLNPEPDEESQGESDMESESAYDNYTGQLNHRDIDLRSIRLDNIIFGNGGFLFNRNGIVHRISNHIPSILLNSNDIHVNFNESTSDDVLFLNPFLEKPVKNENNTYFEETLQYPFMLYIMSDELFDFYKPAVYISVINRLNRRLVELSNAVFQFRYINPFEKKSKRNLYFALNACKEKVLTAYYKEFSKLSDNTSHYCSEQMKNFISSYDTVDSMKEQICKELGIDLKEFKAMKYDEEKSQNENRISRSDSESIIVSKSPERAHEKNQQDEGVNTNESNVAVNHTQNFTLSNINQKESEKKKDEEIDEQLLEQIPEELREDVIKKHKSLIENKTIVNQFNPSDLVPEILSQVNPDLLPGLGGSLIEGHAGPISDAIMINPSNADNANTNSNLPAVAGNNNSNAADDPVAFINSLPPDLREEVLQNMDPEIVERLPQEMKDEYQRLSDIGRILFFQNPISSQRGVMFGNINPSNPLINPANQIDIDNVNRFNRYRLSYNNVSIPGVPKKYTLVTPKFKIEDILLEQRHFKENSSFILTTFDDEFLENLLSFNIKFICESTPKSKINNNQYWILVNNLLQNAGLRHKIFDILFLLWICDSMCLKSLMNEGGNGASMHQLMSKNILLRNLYELYMENKILEEFFYDDYDQFIKNFCLNYQKEMKKLFLETSYSENGQYVSNETKKAYAITKNSKMIKDVLKLEYEKEENVLSNLFSLMLINSKSDIKKIFALKIFTNIVTNCLRSKDTAEITVDIKQQKNGLHISNKTIEKIVELFYNFETVLELNKDRRSNNPTQLLGEMVLDHKCLKILLSALQSHIERLNEGVSYEMEHLFSNRRIEINMFSKPLPENVLFKMVKLVNHINSGILKRSENEEKTGMLVDIPETEDANNNIGNQSISTSNIRGSSKKEKPKPKVKKSLKIKSELNEFIKSINSQLIKCWEKLDMLLFEISKMMKDDQKILDPKLNRMIPYLEAFITLSHLQFLPDGKNTIEFNPFIMEQAYRKTPRKTPQRNTLPNANITSLCATDFSDFFFRFCEKNKKVINLILRRYPKMFPPEILIKISHFLDLENKKKYFRYELKKLKSGREHINLNVRREELFLDSYTQLRFKKPEEIRGKLTIRFDGEEAIDAGGVKREWFTLLSKEMFNPNYMLFKLGANGSTYLPNSESGMFNTDHLHHFTFVGRVIAKAIYDGFMLECYFTRSCYKLICNIPLTYHDMEDYDPQYFKNLKWLLETDISEMGELFTFSYVEDKFGQVDVIDLIENGRNVIVTEDNKFDYVQKLCYAKLFENIKPQVEAFQKGFYEIIPLKLISIFDHRELELVISGLPTIDINDLKNNTAYENYNSESQIIKWFWDILDSYDNSERAEFLQFVTGSSKVPLEGFAALQGIGGVNKFTISKVFDKNFDRLPTAHTCTNQLDLPEYPSKEILYERINLAIKEGKVGFGFI